MKASLIMLTLLLCVTNVCSAQNASANKEKPSSDPAVQIANVEEAARLNRQVISLYQQRKYDEAMPLAQRILAFREQSAERDDIKIALAVSNLAAIYFAKENYKDAKQLFERASKLYELKPDSEPLFYSQTLQSLASLAILDRDYSKAESRYARAIAVEEKKLGPTHPNLGSPLLQLAALMQFRGSNKQARDHYRRALDAFESLPRPVTESIANTLQEYTCKMMDVEDDKDRMAVNERINRIIAHPPTPNIEPSAELPQPRRLRGGVLNGKTIFKAEPDYPREAMRNRAEGNVLVTITIDPAGKVIEAQAKCGNSFLRQASVEAARKWKFSPTKLSGQPVEVTGTVIFRFTLQ